METCYNTKLYFLCGGDNQKFWDFLEKLHKKAKVVKSEWQGDLYVTEYDLYGKKYVYEHDMEYGIPYCLTKVEES